VVTDAEIEAAVKAWKEFESWAYGPFDIRAAIKAALEAAEKVRNR
jgi:hypothetical protein